MCVAARARQGMTITIHCSFDKIYSHLGEQPLGSLRVFLQIRPTLISSCTIPTDQGSSVKEEKGRDEHDVTQSPSSASQLTRQGDQLPNAPVALLGRLNLQTDSE